MKTIIPVDITESIITSTTLTKTYPTNAWVDSTTYALNDIVYVAGSNLLRTAYKSLQNTNVNKNPATETNWWINIGKVYPLYNAGTSYSLDDIVEETGTYLLFQSAADSNLGNPLTDTTKWVAAGVSNYWAMFYTLSNAQSEVGSPFTLVLTPGVRINSLGIVGLEANTLTIDITSSAVSVYNEVINLDSREVLDWYDYFFEPFSTLSRIVRFQLPPYVNGVITITLERTQGLVKSGTMIIGAEVNLGEAQLNAENDALNFSTITRNFEGNINTLTQRRSVPKTNQVTFFDKNILNKIRAAREVLNAVPTIWSGLDDSETNDYFENFLICGLYKRFSISADNPNHATATLEVEEI